MFTDVFGNTLEVGSEVVCLRTVRRSTKSVADNCLYKATVIGFSKQKVRVQYEVDGYITTRFSEQVCKYVEPIIESI